MCLTFSWYVRGFIFHACPVLSLRVISLHLPSGRLVSLCFVSLSFPLVFISVPCMSLLVPLCFPFMSRCFPVISTSYFLPSFPCTSLHFLFAPQYFPQKTWFPSVFAIRTSKFQIFCKRRQEPQTSKEPAGGIEPGTPVFRHRPRRLRLVERHQIAARFLEGGVRVRRRAGGGLGAGLSSILS